MLVSSSVIIVKFVNIFLEDKLRCFWKSERQVCEKSMIKHDNFDLWGFESICD
jgi:hypothetical protein